MTPEIIFESRDFAVIDKPAGLLMHPLPNRPEGEPTLAAWILKKYPETSGVGDAPGLRPGIVHRLDRDTSGAVLVARTPEAFAALKKLFQSRAVRKTYLAIVRGWPDRERGIIRKPMGIVSGTTRRSTRSPKMRKDAVTEYHVLQKSGTGDSKTALLEVLPHTGRTHQIRVHLTSIGHPVFGDPLYGPKLQPEWASRLMLHALRLEFAWAGADMKFCAEPDKSFLRAIAAGGFRSRNFCKS